MATHKPASDTRTDQDVPFDLDDTLPIPPPGEKPRAAAGKAGKAAAKTTAKTVKPKAKAPATRAAKTVAAKKAKAAGAEPDTDNGEAPPARPTGGRAVKGGKGNQLLILESPAKSKTIGKFLGSAFTVKASFGHVRDIPNRGRGKNAFGIDFDNRYQPYYEPLAEPQKKKVLAELQSAAKRADHVWLAPDPDREGEAIAWHLKEALGLSDSRVSRVTFNAITKSAVLKALENPTSINMNLVNAQQGRRVLDRLVGFSLSPLLWRKIAKGLSAGRVQSVAARLVVDREKEIRAFKAEEFWRIAADFAGAGAAAAPEDNPVFEAQLAEWGGEKFVLGHPAAANTESAEAVAARLRAASYSVDGVEERELKRKAQPPFITSTLQQAASTFLGFPVQKTMRIAQQLYEGMEVAGGQATGLITYMRTDSTRLAPEALADARQFIEDNYDPRYLPERPQQYSSRSGAQDAHEAVRPTSAALTPAAVRGYLTPDQYRLYDLVWRRFIASQMTPAVYLVTTVTIPAADGAGKTLGVFEAKGRRTLFDGHTTLALGSAAARAARSAKTAGDGDDAGRADAAAIESGGEKAEGASEPDQDLPALSGGDALDLRDLRATQHFTQPPPRYSEASLVRALEKEGIGRPSTYAPIVATIQDRGYVRLDKRRFFATELGIAVSDLLLQGFPDIMDTRFTAKMEGDLDAVEEGKEDWAEVMDRFWKPFAARVEDAAGSLPALKGSPAPEGVVCPTCGGAMSMRYSQNGAFLGCNNYPDCRGTRPMPGEDNPAGAPEDGEAEEPETCPACGLPMARKTSRFGPFWACTGYPECKKTKPIDRQGKTVALPDIKRDCEKCGKPMEARLGRRGPFLACTGYPECKNTKPIDKNGQMVELPDAGGAVCEKCGKEMVVRLSRRGPFLSCSGYPKCKNARNLDKKSNEK